MRPAGRGTRRAGSHPTVTTGTGCTAPAEAVRWDRGLEKGLHPSPGSAISTKLPKRSERLQPPQRCLLPTDLPGTPCFCHFWPLY